MKLQKYLRGKKKDEILIITSSSIGVHSGFANAQPHPRKINIRKIHKILLFSYRVCHYFMLLRRAKDCRGRSRKKVFIHTTYHGNELSVVENTLWALGLCILFLGKKWLSWNANLPYSCPSHCGIINNAVSCCPEVRSLERKKRKYRPYVLPWCPEKC